jgi:hypothetical protein
MDGHVANVRGSCRGLMSGGVPGYAGMPLSGCRERCGELLSADRGHPGRFGAARGPRHSCGGLRGRDGRPAAARPARAQTARLPTSAKRDPIHDPRIPAQASQKDPNRCARCGGMLQPRRGDAPRLLSARTRRYEKHVAGIRAACQLVEVLVSDLVRARWRSEASGRGRSRHRHRALVAWPTGPVTAPEAAQGPGRPVDGPGGPGCASRTLPGPLRRSEASWWRLWPRYGWPSSRKRSCGMCGCSPLRRLRHRG